MTNGEFRTKNKKSEKKNDFFMKTEPWMVHLPVPPQQVFTHLLFPKKKKAAPFTILNPIFVH